jgi:thymidine kinase
MEFTFNSSELLAAIFIFIMYKYNLIKFFKTIPKKQVISYNYPNKVTNDIGSLTCIVGNMFSGKTSKMLECVTRYSDINQSTVLVINHTLDVERKVGNMNNKLGISSHSSQHLGISKNIKCIYTTKLSDIDVSEYKVIGIDEVQFYPDLYDTIVQWLKLGKHIYCSGLDGCYKSNNFGEVHRLLPISDDFIKLKAVCHFCRLEHKDDVLTPNLFVPAPFTSKISGDYDTSIEIGGSDKYLPTCRYHHNKLSSI